MEYVEESKGSAELSATFRDMRWEIQSRTTVNSGYTLTRYLSQSQQGTKYFLYLDHKKSKQRLNIARDDKDGPENQRMGV
ncbi:hypothetical protein EYF80_022426 [Liparis tanakae]|uniref:Uncharacterized protein n=1 Tax=Liparis tanakae TaxID=230148 RepID=A0A4Z2HNB9_9TELE|nr:hypothetical protein EYF80_022426 [Liparis tanakae]